MLVFMARNKRAELGVGGGLSWSLDCDRFQIQYDPKGQSEGTCEFSQDWQASSEPLDRSDSEGDSNPKAKRFLYSTTESAYIAPRKQARREGLPHVCVVW